MNKLWLLLVWLLPVVVPAGSGDDFHNLLAEGGLVFEAPAGFHPLPVQPDFVMPYEARYLSDDGRLEIRYAIRPLDRIEIDYQDPHNAAPAPNDLFNMLFRALSETLARDHQVLSREYPADQAHRLFNAGWAAVGVFDLAKGISDRFTQAMLVAIHQNDKADAYALFLTNDLGAEKARIKKVLGALRFERFENPIHQPPVPTTR